MNPNHCLKARARVVQQADLDYIVGGRVQARGFEVLKGFIRKDETIKFFKGICYCARVQVERANRISSSAAGASSRSPNGLCMSGPRFGAGACHLQ